MSDEFEWDVLNTRVQLASEKIRKREIALQEAKYEYRTAVSERDTHVALYVNSVAPGLLPDNSEGGAAVLPVSAGDPDTNKDRLIEMRRDLPA